MVQSVYNAWVTVQVCVSFSLCIMHGSLCRSVCLVYCAGLCVWFTIQASVWFSLCKCMGHCAGLCVWFTVQVCVYGLLYRPLCGSVCVVQACVWFRLCVMHGSLCRSVCVAVRALRSNSAGPGPGRVLLPVLLRSQLADRRQDQSQDATGHSGRVCLNLSVFSSTPPPPLSPSLSVYHC